MSGTQRDLQVPLFSIERDTLGAVERRFAARKIISLLGVDEAGRGPLAGPVVAAAVALSETADLPGLNDSKQLSERQREALFDAIIGSALAYGVGEASHHEIDRINILQASFLAMRRAIAVACASGFTPELVLVDGNFRIPSGIDYPQQAIIKGDALSRNIAAASILAKVTRDRTMVAYHQQFPQYGFDGHKGYPTKHHRETLQRIGPCAIHRRSFRGVPQE